MTRKTTSHSCAPVWLSLLTMLTGTAAHGQGTYIYHDGYAVTHGCDPTSNDPPAFFLQDAGGQMRVRQHASALAEAPSGNKAFYDGSLKLGTIFPFSVKAHAAQLRTCNQSEGQGTINFQFQDVIEVSAGAHPVGTPVTYTAQIELPVRLRGRGPRCPSNAQIDAQLYLNDQQAAWGQYGPYEGTQPLSISATSAVGQRLRLSLSISGLASAVRYSTSDNICATNEVELTAPVRVLLTADVLGANTRSVNGVNYGSRVPEK